MRNLKRALSLTLASVMLLGMMVVGSNAAAGYDDVSETDNVEAIEVLQSVEVMVGDERGFGPERPVTRAEMAVVMGKLLNLDYNYYTATCPFDDVYDWARGWVGACAANGIVSGRGDGIYDPGATVTAVEAASMLMRALGYFQYSNDYAEGFEVSTVKQGTNIGIFKGVGSSATEPMTRNQVAQIVLNALKTGIVEPDGNTTTFLNPDGTVLATTGKVNYVNVTSNQTYARAISSLQATSIGSTNSGYIVELGERLYDGDLKLYDDRSDDFGRPARHWEYNGKAIGTYVKKELLEQEWTVEVTGKDFYDLLGSDIIKDYTFDITIDGVSIDAKTGTTDNNTVLKATGAGNANSYFDETYMSKTYKTGVGKTGKGVLTQVFLDPDTKHIDVAVINTYLAKATADYSEKRDEVTLNVFGLTSTGSNSNEVFYKYVDACKADGEQAKRLTITSEDFAQAVDMKKDDIVLVTQANGEIKTIADPEVISEAALSAFSLNKYVINDGTQYDYNTTIEFDVETLEDYTSSDNPVSNLKDSTYNLYLDPYGYLIGVELVEATRNYIFLTGIDKGNSNLNVKTSEAAGILLDGTFINFQMNMTDSRLADGNSKFETGHALYNTWCTYTEDKDGTYTLKEVEDFDATARANKPAKAGQFHDLASNGKTIDTKRVSLAGKGVYDDGTTTPTDINKLHVSNYVYGNDDSIYIVAELKEVAARNDIDADFPVPGNGVQDITGNGVLEDETVVIISGVDSIGTGIDNISVQTYDDVAALLDAAKDSGSSDAVAYPGWIYTLFDKDGYVIAAVVVGEDTGTNKNLVYSNNDSVNREVYSKADDEWTWTREVIFNGEPTNLIEKGSGLSKLKGMDENVWYEVTFKADGTVKDVSHAYYAEDGKSIGGGNGAAASDKTLTLTATATAESSISNENFVDNIQNVEKTVAKSSKSTVLYEEVWGLGTDDNDVGTDSSKTAYNETTDKTALDEDNAPSLKSSTLYVNTEAKEGFYVHKDVKSVLIQKNNGQKTTTYGEGTGDLADMLEDLNFTNGSYLFKISAILVDGRATVVVIHDWNETNATGNDKDRNPGEEEETGDINVYVSYRTDTDDPSTQIGEEVTIKLSRAADGRLVLDKATATAKMGAAWKDYFEVTDTVFPKTLTVAEGTSYAEAVVEVTRKTKTLTLPDGWKATWPTSEAKFIDAAGDFTAASATGLSTEVPTGAVVTITPKDDDCDATEFYLYNPYVDEAKQMQAGADGATIAAAWGEFTMPSDKNVTLTSKQYHKVSKNADAIDVNGVSLNDMTLDFSIAGAGATSVTVGTNLYVEETGTVTVSFTLTGTPTSDVSQIKAQLKTGATTGVTSGTFSTADEIIAAAATAITTGKNSDTVTVSASASTKDVELQYQLS